MYSAYNIYIRQVQHVQFIQYLRQTSTACTVNTKMNLIATNIHLGVHIGYEGAIGCIGVVCTVCTGAMLYDGAVLSRTAALWVEKLLFGMVAIPSCCQPVGGILSSTAVKLQGVKCTMLLYLQHERLFGQFF